MAASCLGNFGTYKYTSLASRARDGVDWRGNQYQQQPSCQEGMVWVTQRYTPTDLRVTAPVPRHKPMAVDVKTLPVPPAHWLNPRELSPWEYTRETSSLNYQSHPSTRSEEWSTLRQMLPSSGRPCKTRPPNWGTGYNRPPSMTSNHLQKFPHINSPMTR